MGVEESSLSFRGDLIEGFAGKIVEKIWLTQRSCEIGRAEKYGCFDSQNGDSRYFGVIERGLSGDRIKCTMSIWDGVGLVLLGWDKVVRGKLTCTGFEDLVVLNW
ncbi:hypothetical protein WN48_09439 [Eufriesea mexicana]|uniref:Uncharacterized protein n=1 Tax=Eufriesea mexicana TaxID=516756 RepID=A0A310S9X8_9HYME|nr:hypothetical protein WN48_09439 [Eufriesea mexicana]